MFGVLICSFLLHFQHSTFQMHKCVPVSCPGTPPQREGLGCRRSSSQAGPAPQAPCPGEVCRLPLESSSPRHRDCWMTRGKKPSLCCLQGHFSLLLLQLLPSSGHSHLLRGPGQAWRVGSRGCCSWESHNVGAACWRRREHTHAASCSSCRERRSSSDGPLCVRAELGACRGSSCLAGGVAASSGGDAAACQASWSPWWEGASVCLCLRSGHHRQL